MARVANKVTTMKKYHVLVFVPSTAKTDNTPDFEIDVKATNIGRACGEAVKFLRKTGLKRRKLTVATFTVNAIGDNEPEF